MKKILTLIVCSVAFKTGYACPFCNAEIRKAIFDSTFYPNLLTMLSAFIVLAVMVAILSLITTRRYKAYTTRHPYHKGLNPAPLAAAATVAGIGIGGFIDGIVLHQILQWHEMISAKMPPVTYIAKSVNMFWDGIFHAFVLIVTIISILLLWSLLGRRDINRSGSVLAGGILAGWGLFNIVEGIIDHHLLKLHNVREIAMNPEAWNLGFLALSVILLIAGFLLINRRHQHVHKDTVVVQ